MILATISVLLLSGLIFFIAKRLLRYLQYFQLEEYDSSRFIRWYVQNRAFDKRATACMLLCVGLSSWFGIYLQGLWVFSLCLLALAIFEPDPRTSGKVTLKMTLRARKIWLVSLILSTLVIAFLIYTGELLRASAAVSLLLIILQSPPLLLVLSNLILFPFERALQARFRSEAIKKLEEVKPFVIGITGSFGKTSTKSILGQVLNQSLAPTYWPQKGINTVMGITRDIRENLNKNHKYAVIEMGAYARGSIRRLTDFTPPQAAIVTAVHLMHLDRFGGEENVYKAKSELPQAIPENGLLILNGDNPGSRRMAEDFARSRKVILYGLDITKGPLDVVASEPEYSFEGSQFEITYQNKSYPVATNLLGRSAVSNCTGSFAMACALGADPTYVAACMKSLTPVDNRLVLKKTDKALYINDGYNSNPQGFAAALEILKKLPGKKRILMTPGMIELGDKQAKENEKIALLAAGIVSHAIIVGTYNREALLAGLSSGGLAPQQITSINTRDEAFIYLNELVEKDDIVLIENDLTDLHEGRVEF